MTPTTGCGSRTRRSASSGAGTASTTRNAKSSSRRSQRLPAACTFTAVAQRYRRAADLVPDRGEPRGQRADALRLSPNATPQLMPQLMGGAAAAAAASMSIALNRMHVPAAGAGDGRADRCASSFAAAEDRAGAGRALRHRLLAPWSSTPPICAVFAHAVDRYQSRLTPLALLALAVLLVADWRSEPPGLRRQAITVLKCCPLFLAGAFHRPDAAVLRQLAPTGKLRVAIAVAPSPSAQFAIKDGGNYRGVAVTLGMALAEKSGCAAESCRTRPPAKSRTRPPATNGTSPSCRSTRSARNSSTSATPITCCKAPSWWRPAPRSTRSATPTPPAPASAASPTPRPSAPPRRRRRTPPISNSPASMPRSPP